MEEKGYHRASSLARSRQERETMAERTMPRGSMCLRINRLSSTGRTWNGSVLFTIVEVWHVILSFSYRRCGCFS